MIKFLFLIIYLSLFISITFCTNDNDINEEDLESEVSIYILNEVFGNSNVDEKNNDLKVSNDNDTDLWDDCLSEDNIHNNNNTTTNECNRIKRHLYRIRLIRLIGYPISLTALLIGILLIIFIKRLQRPRNIMHTNLFISFMFHTIWTIISVEYMESPKSHLCKLAEFFFRYSSAVYHVSIFAEAFYLVSLLHYPFYTVRIGYKVFICISWLLPLVWLMVWLIVKAGAGVFYEQELCWKPDSIFKLILKIPETFLVFINLILAILIVKAINSRLNFSKEKTIRFKRLAKSLLILLPIVETHFLIFTWLPFMNLQKLSLTTAYILNYIESILYGYQGFLVFLIYTLIQRDLRIECMIFIMKIIKFFSCCCNFENSKLLNLHKNQLESDIAKAYPFKFTPTGTRLNSKIYTESEFNPELNQLTI